MHPISILNRLAFCLLAWSAIGFATARADEPPAPYARATEDERCIKIETDKLEAVIPKNNPKHWMTGVEKGSFLDKQTGFREAGDGLLVIDWIMEPGPDDEWQAQGTKTEKYVYNNDNHGVRPKRIIEGPQLCPHMKPVQPEIIRGDDFVAVKTTYRYEVAAPGHKPGSQWTQLLVFPAGVRYFFSMDQIDSVNESETMFLRNDMPGCVRHQRGETFSEIYLSYLGGPQGMRIEPSEFFEVFSPDVKFSYRRGEDPMPEHFIRGYKLRDPETGKEGPWLAGIALQPSEVYEAWCNQRPGIIIFILETHGRPTKPGDTFSAAYLVGYFDDIEQMHALDKKYQGHTGLSADKSGWRLVE